MEKLLKKKLILLRHAKTEPYFQVSDDYLRNLTERGVADCQLIINALSADGHLPQAVIASPANRALQTARLFASGFGLEVEDIQYERSIYEGLTTSDFLNLIAQTDDQIETLLFVGHNPDIAAFAYNLTTDFGAIVPTCSAIVLQFSVDTWSQIKVRSAEESKMYIPKTYK